MASSAELDQQLIDAAMATANAAVRAMEAATSAAFADGDARDLNVASAYAAWANQASNTARELLAGLAALRSSTPPTTS